MIPVAGSAYTYTYATMGEFLAWIIGWDLILEYLFSGAAVAVSWSGAIQEFLAEPWFGIKVPRSSARRPSPSTGRRPSPRTSWASPTNTTRWLPRAPWSTCPRSSVAATMSRLAEHPPQAVAMSTTRTPP